MGLPQFWPHPRRALLFTIVLILAVMGIVLFKIRHLKGAGTAESADALLENADDLSWNNQWIVAQPLYSRAEAIFLQRGMKSKALYAEVSQIPSRVESASLPATILQLTQDLARPEAQDPETRLRILTIRGMIEVNYDAAMARTTWSQVAALARQQHHLLLASRAMGEQGIAAFMLGDLSSAKRQVIAAWEVSKFLHDPAAHVRYASLYGAGLIQLHRYQEALIPLDEAINTATRNPEVVYPYIAIGAKVDALRGLHRYQEALTLANQALAHIPSQAQRGRYYQILTSRGRVYEEMGDLDRAIADYSQALAFATQLEYWRGVSEVGGFLAVSYERRGNLQQALETINRAIDANARVPDELYLVPRNLGIKAEIEERLGSRKEADALYQKSATLIDSFLQHVSTRNVERLLLAELSEVYSGYFSSMCEEHNYNRALHVLEEARGRIEAQALEHHEYPPLHAATQEEQRLTNLNLSLIATDDPVERRMLMQSIYETELKMNDQSLESITATRPVDLVHLQHNLAADEVLIEYVLADSHSYALAITNETVRSYQLASRSTLEDDATKYRSEISKQQTDVVLANKLFDELLGPLPEFQLKSTVVVVPDGNLHLLPFDALVDHGQYLITSHTISTSPSATVFDILRHRTETTVKLPLPYVGVAAWTNQTVARTPIFAAISSPEHRQLEPLPDSKKEVEEIADDLPKPSTLLLGSEATETHFKSLPLNDYDVLHLALHGYIDEDYPDRSALVFAPQAQPTDDGLLQVREIRGLHLNASLVTLSACDTGVGPVSEAGVANLVNAFIEAGAESVVSTLWELEDHSTAHLMNDFYQHLARREPKASALRQAQLDLMQEGFSPYYWASFELVGDPSGLI